MREEALKKIAILAVVLMTLAAASAQTKAQPFSFKSDRLGMTLREWQEVHELVPPSAAITYTDACQPATAKHPIQTCLYSEPSETIAGCPIKSVMYWFVNDRLYSVYISVRESCYEEVVSAMRAKYGKPSRAKSKTYQNGFGAKFVGGEVTWINGVSFVSVEQYAGDRETSSVLYWHFSLGAKADKYERQQKAKAAEDL